MAVVANAGVASAGAIEATPGASWKAFSFHFNEVLQAYTLVGSDAVSIFTAVGAFWYTYVGSGIAGVADTTKV